MKYPEFKRVYVDKSLTLEDWTQARGSTNISAGIKGITFETWRRSREPSEPVTRVEDAKTFAEFQTYWAGNYSVKVSGELKDLDFKAVKTASQGIELVLKEFPTAAPLLTEFRVYSDDNIMSTSYWGQISFNPKYFNDFEKLQEMAGRNAASGFHPKNTGVREYGAHEAGHILELALIQKYGGNVEDWKNGTYARKIVRRAYNATKNTLSENILKLRQSISKYAFEYGVSETLAESLTDYIANKDNSAILSKGIWKILKEELS